MNTGVKNLFRLLFEKKIILTRVFSWKFFFGFLSPHDAEFDKNKKFPQSPAAPIPNFKKFHRAILVIKSRDFSEVMPKVPGHIR